MRIIVVNRHEGKINIYFPLFILSFLLRVTPKFVLKHILKKAQAKIALDDIDLRAISRAIYSLRKYKGLAIVEIKESNGSEVLIKI
ncbi:conserved hypothetical protein [Caldicellulosiruptor hydrothermalis 108]|uniref:Uncharacterized protein n=1 Tax=Caldicellulosiruptor hydrothermalis (strain DSM 18901 / VKM B-2411 / 108) TaxID=632292 RepID=E4Q8T9_CALH1|nr:hypothetical protein [Caldicellulosiruptor hydrothermalis]ADQ08063.1 conserved hypothetical protein [Caldicellulosiruptor hydrothermalis 108]